MKTKLPGPRSPKAVIGLARRLNTNARSTLLEMVDTYGPVIDFGRGKYHYIYLLSPEANEYILSTAPENFTWRDAFWVLVPVNGEIALVVSDGEDHKRRRRIVQPAFHMRRIASYLDVMVDETNQVIDQWAIGASVDAHAQLRLAIRRIVLRCLFGDALRERDEELSRHLEVALAYVNRPPTQRFDWNLPGMPYRKAMKARAAVDQIVFDAEGGPVTIRLVKPCARCGIPNIDPATAEPGAEPGRTLAGFRSDPRVGGAVTFGMNAIVLDGADRLLRVGQTGQATFKV